MACMLASLLLSAVTGVSAYDYVVVGGGTAGSVVAARLAATNSVLLLNIAGPPPSQYNGAVMTSDEYIIGNNLSATPGMRTLIHQPGYKAVPFFSTRETGSSPARYLGGSSLVGLSHFLYDKDMDWAHGWDWNVMQNYMLKSKVQPTHHPAYLHSLTQEFMEAVPEARATPSAQRPDGTKVTAHAAYLNQKPEKLTIMDNVRADRLIISNGICQGVVVRDLVRGGERSIYAAKEVIVSAGYLWTPRLLFLSGIGDAKDLSAAGLKVVKDLPAVGKHLTAPRFTPLSWRTNKPTFSRMMGPPISKGPAVTESFSSVVAEATVHLGKDAMAQFMPLYYSPKSAPLQYSLQGESWPLETNAYTVLVTMATAAKGAIKFDRDPDVSPTITHDPMTPGDLERGAEAVRAAELLGAKLSSEGRVVNAQEWSAVYDGRGTCRMGDDPLTSVVDSSLRVHGTRGLRIVDGSVLPSNTPFLAMPEVLMLAERAADLITDIDTHSAFDLAHGTSLLESLNPVVTVQQMSEASPSHMPQLFLFCVGTIGVAALFLLPRRRQLSGVEADGDVYIQA